MASQLKVVVLVGNGFDLSTGMNTSAKTFIRDFVENNSVDTDEQPATPAERLAAHISSEGIETWGDFERKLGDYASYIAAAVDEPDRVNEYLDAKDAVDLAMQKRLSSESSRIDDIFVSENAADCFTSLAKWTDCLHEEERNAVVGAFSNPIYCEYSFVSFNYTPVFEQLLNSISPTFSELTEFEGVFPKHTLGSFCYAHGKLENTPVCGVDNAGQIADEALGSSEDVTEAMIKSQIQRMYATTDDRVAMNVIKSADIVLVYGMSLGATDKRWWEAILKGLSDRANRFLVIFSRKADRAQQTPSRYRRFLTDTKGKLFSAAGIQDDEFRKQVENRVFIASSKNMLVIPHPLDEIEARNLSES